MVVRMLKVGVGMGDFFHLTSKYLVPPADRKVLHRLIPSLPCIKIFCLMSHLWFSSSVLAVGFLR